MQIDRSGLQSATTGLGQAELGARCDLSPFGCVVSKKRNGLTMTSASVADRSTSHATTVVAGSRAGAGTSGGHAQEISATSDGRAYGEDGSWYRLLRWKRIASARTGTTPVGLAAEHADVRGASAADNSARRRARGALTGVPAATPIRPTRKPGSLKRPPPPHPREGSSGTLAMNSSSSGPPPVSWSQVCCCRHSCAQPKVVHSFFARARACAQARKAVGVAGAMVGLVLDGERIPSVECSRVGL